SSPSGAGAGLMPSARPGPLFFLGRLPHPTALYRVGAACSAWTERPQALSHPIYSSSSMVLEDPYNQPVSARADVEPRILERSDHPISRRDIDKNAVKVLYRLHN